MLVYDQSEVSLFMREWTVHLRMLDFLAGLGKMVVGTESQTSGLLKVAKFTAQRTGNQSEFGNILVEPSTIHRARHAKL